jgi:hypothetical protein
MKPKLINNTPQRIAQLNAKLSHVGHHEKELCKDLKKERESNYVLSLKQQKLEKMIDQLQKQNREISFSNQMYKTRISEADRMILELSVLVNEQWLKPSMKLKANE